VQILTQLLVQILAQFLDRSPGHRYQGRHV